MNDMMASVIRQSAECEPPDIGDTSSTKILWGMQEGSGDQAQIVSKIDQQSIAVVPTGGDDDDAYSAPFEPIFTLFQRLPVELRLMIWKHSLPGPRVVRYETKELLTSAPRVWYIRNLCSLMNGNISDIACSCKEVLGVVKARFSKLVVAEASYMTPLDLPFVYIDYQQDTLYIEPWRNHDDCIVPRVAHRFSKVRHLAVRRYDQPLSVKNFKDLRRHLLVSLEQLTFVPYKNLQPEYFSQEWKILKFNQKRKYDLEWPSDMKSEYSFLSTLDIIDLLDVYGELGLLTAKLHADQPNISKIIGKFSDWDNVSIFHGYPVIKYHGSHQWYIQYFLRQYFIREQEDHDTDQEENSVGEDDENETPYEYHHHLEPVELGKDNALQSCKPAPQSVENKSCEYCDTRRWVRSNDMFWTLKEYADDHEAESDDDKEDSEDDTSISRNVIESGLNGEVGQEIRNREQDRHE